MFAITFEQALTYEPPTPKEGPLVLLHVEVEGAALGATRLEAHKHHLAKSGSRGAERGEVAMPSPLSTAGRAGVGPPGDWRPQSLHISAQHVNLTRLRPAVPGRCRPGRGAPDAARRPPAAPPR